MFDPFGDQEDQSINNAQYILTSKTKNRAKCPNNRRPPKTIKMKTTINNNNNEIQNQEPTKNGNMFDRRSASRGNVNRNSKTESLSPKTSTKRRSPSSSSGLPCRSASRDSLDVNDLPLIPPPRRPSSPSSIVTQTSPSSTNKTQKPNESQRRRSESKDSLDIKSIPPIPPLRRGVSEGSIPSKKSPSPTLTNNLRRPSVDDIHIVDENSVSSPFSRRNRRGIRNKSKNNSANNSASSSANNSANNSDNEDGNVRQENNESNDVLFAGLQPTTKSDGKRKKSAPKIQPY
eukprot:Pgem_evm1s5052